MYVINMCVLTVGLLIIIIYMSIGGINYTVSMHVLHTVNVYKLIS